jgi:hypothetical protein
MVRHFRYSLTGDVRARFFKYFRDALYAGCARVETCGEDDAPGGEETEVIPHAHLLLDIATLSADEAASIADRLGSGLCLDCYELARLDEA